MNTRKKKITIKWSKNFAYAIGLIVSDGNVSPDGRHITFTSKDLDLIQQFLLALNIKDHYVGKKARGNECEKKYFVVQIGDVNFHEFLVRIGIMPKKSKKLSVVQIPERLFSHFVRGVFDGDGTCYSYFDPRWKSSFMFYTAFASASPIFLRWFQEKLLKKYDIKGSINKGRGAEQLNFAKKSSQKLFQIMYRNADNLYLKRKYLKLLAALTIIPSVQEKNARMEKLVNSPA